MKVNLRLERIKFVGMSHILKKVVNFNKVSRIYILGNINYAPYWVANNKHCIIP
jgi:hypothetical protein